MSGDPASPGSGDLPVSAEGPPKAAVALARAARPSLAKTLRMWVLTVFTETDSSLAISGLQRLHGR